MRALIADDDRITTAILSATLQRWNIEAAVANDGGAAWDLLTGRDVPSLAIIDWMMPTVDGLELRRRIRRDPARAHMYVILLTGRDNRADVVAGLEAGADDYIVKPFDPDELHGARAGRHPGAHCRSAWPTGSSSSSRRFRGSSVCRACCLFAATASGSAATIGPGSRWMRTSSSTPTPSLPTGSVLSEIEEERERRM